MMEKLRGRVWKYGDDVNTDVLFPGRYTYTVRDPKEMAAHALEDLDPDFAANVEPGAIVVGGRNFGCGSSREQAAFALKYAGVTAVVAKSFARLYFRNAINAGLVAVANPQVVDAVEAGDIMGIDVENGIISTPKGDFSFPALDENAMGILEAGGLIEYAKKQIEEAKNGKV